VQCGDPNLEVPTLRCPATSVKELLFWYEQAIGLQGDQKQIEGARAELDRNPVGEQLPAA